MVQDLKGTNSLASSSGSPAIQFSFLGIITVTDFSVILPGVWGGILYLSNVKELGYTLGVLSNLKCDIDENGFWARKTSIMWSSPMLPGPVTPLASPPPNLSFTPSASLNIPSMLTSQGLCPCCSLFLECGSSTLHQSHFLTSSRFYSNVVISGMTFPGHLLQSYNPFHLTVPSLLSALFFFLVLITLEHIKHFTYQVYYLSPPART